MSGTERHTRWMAKICVWGLLVAAIALPLLATPRASKRAASEPSGSRAIDDTHRQTVVFWHFWGGDERAVVDQLVARFNRSQTGYLVRATAMPGNNLDLKLFLSVTGGDPPDVVNQDDPILADWAMRGALLPLAKVASRHEIEQLREWLFPAAWKLGTYQKELFGLCNGLDVRALYYNADLLEKFQLSPPQTIAELDTLARTIAPPDERHLTRLGFLPNPRNLWAWGIVFGGQFFDETEQRVTLDHPCVVQALEWMSGYGRRYGSAAVAFRARDQSLPGKTFPLIANRYAAVVDGQWRTRDLRTAAQAAIARGEEPVRYGVVPLPPPPGGRSRAGWVNGNFFLVPRGAKCPQGAWEFMKFWSGFGGHEFEAARTCAAGGWIPVSQHVVDESPFQDFLRQQPIFQTFVNLAAAPDQIPRPNIPGAQRFDREVRQVAERAMFGGDEKPVAELLHQSSRILQHYLETRGERVR